MTECARLTDAPAFAARPRAYAVHDTALQGFMLRIRPNGARARVSRMMIPPLRGGCLPSRLPESLPLRKLASAVPPTEGSILPPPRRRATHRRRSDNEKRRLLEAPCAELVRTLSHAAC